MATLPVDDRDLDDAALWAVIDSAAAATAASFSSPPTSKKTTTPRFRSPLALTHHPNFHTPPSNDNDFRRPHKILRPNNSSSSVSELSNHWDIKPAPELGRRDLSPYVQECFSPSNQQHLVLENKENFTHCLSGRFPTVSLFKDYQDAAMAVLDKSDYTMISGNPFIKKSGWRKIAFFFNVSFEIKDKTIEFDNNRDVQRAEFVVRASMQGGRFSDGWGSCERREKRFMKPNNDIPSTAETRAKNRACQDLIGIGQYRAGASHSHNPSPR